MNWRQELGVQSYCFRNFTDNARVAEMIRSIGVTAVELCGVHTERFANPKNFGSIIAAYRQAGLEIVSIGVQHLAGEPAEEQYFEFAVQAGAKYMSVSFPLDRTPACYRAAEQRAEKYGLRLAIHNHGGRDWLGSGAMLNHVFANTSDRIGLCLDTAWCLDSGEDPVAWAEKFAKRLYGIHLKDFTFDRARKHEDVVVGTGNLRLPEFLAALKKNGFDGYSVIEYEGDVNDPAPALKRCVAAIQKELKNV